MKTPPSEYLGTALIVIAVPIVFVLMCFWHIGQEVNLVYNEWGYPRGLR